MLGLELIMLVKEATGDSSSASKYISCEIRKISYN